MSEATFKMAVRLRLPSTTLTAAGMLSVILMVGALFPAVGGSIGKLDLPQGVADLLGGADYGTLTGWMRSEIGAVYGPLVIAATAITGAAALTAGEEEDGILGLVLAHPVERSRVVLAKGAAVGVCVCVISLGTWLGLVAASRSRAAASGSASSPRWPSTSRSSDSRSAPWQWRLRQLPGGEQWPPPARPRLPSSGS